MKFLVIQTAFIGDVILATAVACKLKRFFPDAQVDFLVRKGNESLLQNHPCISHVLVWNKREKKLLNFLKLIVAVRKSQYHTVVNLHRFVSSGIITALSGARATVGFDKNPMSFFFTGKFQHTFGLKDGVVLHEVERNLSLISQITDVSFQMPQLYPAKEDEMLVENFCMEKFITISPASVWFTKQLPAVAWIDFINQINGVRIFLLGSAQDVALCNLIKQGCPDRSVEILAGRLTLLQSAALMKRASMNYVNDSAPLHISSAMNAPVTAVYCSTTPEFGFGPLSSNKVIVETDENLECRPCGLHGRRNCPQGHFRCAQIDTAKLVARLV